MRRAPALAHLALGEPLRRRLHDLEFGDRRLAEPSTSFEPLRRRRNHLGERAEFLEQRLGERLHVALRDGAEQHQLQHLVVGERLRPGFEEARAQALAMAVIVRRGFGEAGDCVSAACATACPEYAEFAIGARSRRNAVALAPPSI